MAKERSTEFPEPGALIAENLRRAGRQDAPVIAEWLCRPEINRYLSSNLRDCGLDAGLVNAALRRPDQLWSVFSGDDASPAGLIALESIDLIDGVANIWYLLARSDATGRGLTSAAIARFCAANPAGLHTLTAWVGEPNTASLRCLEIADFHVIGRIAGGFVFEGARYDRILYERVLAASG